MFLNGSWELKTKKKAICRWFIAWEKLGMNAYAGAIAGYSGGGSFVVERFYAIETDGELTSLWIDFNDVIKGKEIDFDKCGQKALAAAEKGLDSIWEWNNNDVWNDTDEVILCEEKRGNLTLKKELFYLDKDQTSFLKIICEKAGLTAFPST